MNDEALKFPIGKFSPQDSYSSADLDACIRRISSLPQQMEILAGKLSPSQLGMAYRPGGWTARQVIHHVADSHLNAYIRFKWTLTESSPTIKAYNEKLWAETPDVEDEPRIAIDLLKALHVKWVSLLSRMGAEDFSKEYIHPESQKRNRLDRVVAMYAWHGEHHLGHLKIVAEKRH